MQSRRGFLKGMGGLAAVSAGMAGMPKVHAQGPTIRIGELGALTGRSRRTGSCRATPG